MSIKHRSDSVCESIREYEEQRMTREEIEDKISENQAILDHNLGSDYEQERI